jgi:hypothetical protein
MGGSDGTAPPILILALDGGEWSDSRPASLAPGEIIPRTPWIGGWVNPITGRTLWRSWNPVVQPVAIPTAVFVDSVVYKIVGDLRKIQKKKPGTELLSFVSPKPDFVVAAPVVRLVLDGKGTESGLIIARLLFVFLSIKHFSRLLHRSTSSVTETRYLKKSSEKPVVPQHSLIRTTENSGKSQPGNQSLS